MDGASCVRHPFTVMNKKIDFNPISWFTPNTYEKNFKEPTSTPGVYVITNSTIDWNNKTKELNILYVGSTKNLKQRYSRHEVLRVLREVYDFCQFFFIEHSDYLALEKELIVKYQPKFNTQWLKDS